MQTDSLFKLIMDSSHFICYVIDVETYELVYLNAKAKQVYNINNDESYIGKKCYNFLHSFDASCTFCDSETLDIGDLSTIKTKLSIDSKLYRIQSTIIVQNCRQLRMCIAFDATQVHSKIAGLEEELHTEKTLQKCIQTLLHNKNTDTAIYELLSILGNFYQAERASLFEVDELSGFTAHNAEWCVNPTYNISNLKPVFPNAELAHLFSMFKEKGEAIITDAEKEFPSDSKTYKLLKEARVKSGIFVPLYEDDKLKFFIAVDNGKKETTDFSLMHSVALFINDEFKKRSLIEQLKTLSYTDSLTGIYNRNKYIERIENIDTRALKSLGVIHVDANSLKGINEIYGDEYGDTMLKEITAVLSKFIREDLFRIAGDEFVGFCLDISQEDFEELVNKIRKEYSINPNHPFAIGSIWQDKRIDLPLAVKQSGEIMLAEKKNYYKNLSPNTLLFNSHSDEVVLSEIQKGLYSVYLQPKVKLLTSEICGAEALIRKFDEEGKPVSPAKFISIYENDGTIRYIDFFALEQVCILMRQLIDEGRPLKIAVNFSRVTFMGYDIVDEIIKICAKHDIPHKYIKIEITESIDKMDLDFYTQKITAISEAGFDVSLDDFGAMHSNLMMLARSEFKEVKIDKGLIDNITTSTQNRTIIRNIIKIINELGTSDCVCEGIETQEQRKILLEQGCEIGQGYLFYRPMPIADFLKAYEEDILKAKYDMDTTSTEDLQSYTHTLPAELSAAALDAMPLCMNLWNHKTQNIMCNTKAVELFEVESHEEYLTKFFKLSPEFQPDGQTTAEMAFKYLNETRYHKHVQFNWMHSKLNGEEIPAEVTLCKISVLSDVGEAFVTGYTRDLRPQFAAYDNGTNPETFFYGDASYLAICNATAELSDAIFWTYTNKTSQIKFYGRDIEELGLSNKKNLFPNDELLALVEEKDIDTFMLFVEALLEGFEQELIFRFKFKGRESSYYKIKFIVTYQDEKPIHSIGSITPVVEQES